MRTAYLTTMFILGMSGLASAAVFSENFEGATAFRPIDANSASGYGYFPYPANTPLPAIIPGTQFSLIAGTIDVLSGPDFGSLCTAPAGGKCIDTTGSTGSGNSARGVIETTNDINIGPGAYYLLFSLVRWNFNGVGPQDTSLQVQFGSFVNQTINVNSGYVDGTIQIAFNVPSAALAKITFSDLGLPASAGFAGAILDNVVIVSQSEVPEPATYAVVGLGLAALAGLRKKR